MQLLYTKRSPFARKVRVLALEKKINLDLVDEDLQHKSLRLEEANPLGKVPTLILEDGSSVFDSGVICQYLDTLNDHPVLIPAGGQARIEVLKWASFADDLMVLGINVFMEKQRHPDNFNDAYIKTIEKNILRAYAYMGQHAAVLEPFSLASIAVASGIGYIGFRLPHLKPEGPLARWYEDILKRPSMAATIPVI